MINLKSCRVGACYTRLEMHFLSIKRLGKKQNKTNNNPLWNGAGHGGTCL